MGWAELGSPSPWHWGKKGFSHTGIRFCLSKQAQPAGSPLPCKMQWFYSPLFLNEGWNKVGERGKPSAGFP